jgi:hydroxyacylglutathione hydrolase
MHPIQDWFMQIYPILSTDYDSNIYLVTGKTPTLIDTGTGFNSKTVLEEIGSVIDPGSIQQIILTHEHYDHVGGTPDFLKATGGNAKVGALKDIVEKLKAGKSTFAEMLGGHMPSLEVTLPLHDGMTLQCGDDEYTVLATPGHSPGSICLYSPKQKVVFSGDTVFAGGGYGRYDFPGGSYDQLLASVKLLLTLDVEALYSGHGPDVTRDALKHIRQAHTNILIR